MIRTSSKKVFISSSLRHFVYVTAALAGATVMIIEVLGTRMLSPYMGSSHFVWTAQIAITLIALATGYYLGGLAVNKFPKLDCIYLGLIAAAIYLSFTSIACPSICIFFLQFDLPTASLLTSFILFFLPLTLLAMVGPFLTQTLATSMSTVGAQAGRLSSIGTFGSFAGTILIGYYLIPYLYNSSIIYFTALLLGLTGCIYFAVWGTRNMRAAIFVLCIAALSASSFGINREKEITTNDNYIQLYSGNSYYGLIRVIEKNDLSSTFLVIDNYPQNSYNAPTKSSDDYVIYVMQKFAQTYSHGTPDNLLMIGMGAGVGPMYFAKNGSKVDLVEINEALIPVAVKYFDFNPSLFNIFLGDGRYFLRKSVKKYDCIVVDAFLGDSPPNHLMTVEAFQEMHQLLKPGAPLIMNINVNPVMNKFSEDILATSLIKTLSQVFRHTKIYSSGWMNGFIVATDGPIIPIANENTFSSDVPINISKTVMSILSKSIDMDSSKGLVLRDDYNPLDILDAKNRATLHKLFAKWFGKVL
jgi:spermidine synthase